ncbi:Fusarisetin A cluster transcription factor fsa6 [Pseudocercospora fuligena]|uniref:Fusarisetin A cluster transcription factor fsa6 n=1 Tax=Pseudocercospora fuligena TaxID=685502 RepID=A0A8H6VIR8_9PEZI|nr:Fusarisetin A cluster transcription factor fsa6 [Pseudocercospora fuligena]
MSGDGDNVATNGSNDRTSTPNSQTTQQALNNIANGAHLKQKRARSQLSCIPCRQGKLKCNRSHDPACDQCLKRDRQSACVYVPPPTKQKPTQNVKGRIRQLENLVVDLMNQQNQKGTDGKNDQERQNARRESTNTTSVGPFEQPTPPSDNDTSPHSRPSVSDDVDGATKPFGQMRISKNEISYVGETHWQAILHGISELKRDLGDEAEENGGDEPAEEDPRPVDVFGNAFGNVPIETLTSAGIGNTAPYATTGLGFMLGASATVTRQQLIDSVPEKKVADRLLSLWFNSPDPFKPIIHAPTFQDEYRRFWRDPKDTPTMWLGLFYAILSLAASFGLRDIDPGSEPALRILKQVNQYHTLSASAAVLGDFTKPKQYTVECLILYAAGLRSNDAFVNVWLMIGLVLRLCLRMGYHRDPANYPGISDFDGEMRRRVWAIISMIDVLISFQLGLPSMVKTLQSDTQPPRNLLDRDFNINTKVLPASRGIDELTPSSYTRAKLHIVRIFADASEISHATIPPSYETMMDLDRRLEEGKAMIPPLLQMPDISELVTDPAEQLMCRFNLDLLYLKTKIVLHRRYMEKPFAQLTPHEQTMGIGVSRKTCVDCALRVLRHHHTIYNASQAGGQLESVKWYMGSISTHDFLLAAMIVCLELSQQIGPDSAVINPSGHLCPQRAAMMDALEKSQKIWSEASGRKRTPNRFVAQDEHARGVHMFDETEKPSRAMAAMLKKVKASFPAQAEALSRIKRDEGQRPGMAAQGAGYINDEIEVGITPASNTSSNVQGKMFTPGPPQTTVPFGGIVSYHTWSETAPEDVQYAGLPYPGPNTTPSANGSNGIGMQSTSQSSSNNTSPQQENMDFSMIGDMLDGSTIDWEMFDQGVTKNPNAWDQASSNMDPNNMLVPGNVMMNGGTGPGSGNAHYPGAWIDFNAMDMEGADFGMDGILNYSKASPWPSELGGINNNPAGNVPQDWEASG